MQMGDANLESKLKELTSQLINPDEGFYSESTESVVRELLAQRGIDINRPEIQEVLSDIAFIENSYSETASSDKVKFKLTISGDQYIIEL